MARSSNGRQADIRLAAASHIGASPKRTLLEDRARAETVRTPGGRVLSIAVVADGIGGENAGERAAELTVTTVFERVQASEELNIPRMLEAALREANRRVFSEAQKSRRKTNMGSTAAVAVISNGQLYVANVGDSRIYLLRGQKAFPLTVDHTWENEMVRLGKLSRMEAARHPRRDQIVRSVGYEPDVKVDLGLWLQGGEESPAEARAAQGLPLKLGDVVLVCSDGLIKSRHDQRYAHYVEASEFANLVRGRSPKGAVEGLIKKALNRRVDDNVSAAVMEVPGGVYLRRFVVPAAAAALALAFVVGAAAWAMPRISGALGGPSAGPTIPVLPSGVAFVSEIGGRAEGSGADGEFETLRPEQLIAAGAGVRQRTIGGSSYLRLGLADQSIIYLGPHSQMELLEIEGPAGTSIHLENGVVLVSKSPDSGVPISVIAPSGVLGRITGSAMGAYWDREAGLFEIDCLQDVCVIVFPGEVAMNIIADQRITIDASGEIFGPMAVEYGRYAFGGFAGGLAMAQTSEPSGLAAGPGASPTRTPLGPLFVSPTPVPPTRTPKPPPTSPPGPGPPKPTQPPDPTNTSVPAPTDTLLPPTATPKTPGPKPTKTEKPTDPPAPTPTEPAATDTPVPPPTNPPTDPPPPTGTDPPPPSPDPTE